MRERKRERRSEKERVILRDEGRERGENKQATHNKRGDASPSTSLVKKIKSKKKLRMN